jgi:putative ABC transport system substrate-binding protein
VFADVDDPVARGFVASLARPGGNITGLANLNTDLIGKWLELLKQTVPGVTHVAFLWQPGTVPVSARDSIVKRAEAAARGLGVRLQFVEVRGPEEFERAFSDMTRTRVDAVIVWGGSMMILERRRIAELVARNRLPATYPMAEFVDAGGFMSYSPNIADNFRRAAGYVDRILKGARPADLPVEQSSKFELVVNLKTAKALGLTIPPSLSQRADRVIE